MSKWAIYNISFFFTYLHRLLLPEFNLGHPRLSSSCDGNSCSKMLPTVFEFERPRIGNSNTVTFSTRLLCFCVSESEEERVWNWRDFKWLSRWNWRLPLPNCSMDWGFVKLMRIVGYFCFWLDFWCDHVDIQERAFAQIIKRYDWMLNFRVPVLHYVWLLIVKMRLWV